MSIDATTWVTLNVTVMNATEQECVKALETEVKSQKRRQFALRILCRRNRLRAIRERKELLEKLQ